MPATRCGELRRIVESTLYDAAHLGAGRILALIEEHETQTERITRKCQHPSELACADDAEFHSSRWTGTRGSGRASTRSVCVRR